MQPNDEPLTMRMLLDERNALLLHVIEKNFPRVVLPPGCDHVGQLRLEEIDAGFVITCSAGSVPALDLSKSPFDPKRNRTPPRTHIRKPSAVMHTPERPLPPPPSVSPPTQRDSPQKAPPGKRPPLEPVGKAPPARTATPPLEAVAPRTATPPLEPVVGKAPPVWVQYGIRDGDVPPLPVPPPRDDVSPPLTPRHNPTISIPETPPPPPPPPRDPFHNIHDILTLRRHQLAAYEQILIRTGWLMMCPSEVRDNILDVLRPTLLISVATHTFLLTSLTPPTLHDVVSTSVIGSKRRSSIRVLKDSERADIAKWSVDSDTVRRDAIVTLSSSEHEDAVEFVARQAWALDRSGCLDWYWPLLSVCYVPSDPSDTEPPLEIEAIEPVLTHVASLMKLSPDAITKADTVAFLHSFRFTPTPRSVELVGEKLAGNTSALQQVVLMAKYHVKVDFSKWAPVLMKSCEMLSRASDYTDYMCDACYTSILPHAEKFITHGSKTASEDDLPGVLTEATTLYDDLIAQNGSDYALYAVAALLRVYSDLLKARWGILAEITPIHFDVMRVIHRVVALTIQNKSQKLDGMLWRSFVWLNNASVAWASSTAGVCGKHASSAVLLATWNEKNADERIHPVLSDVLHIMTHQLPALEVILCDDYVTLFEAFSQGMKQVMLQFITELVLPFVPSYRQVEAVVRLNTLEKSKQEFLVFVKQIHEMWVMTTARAPGSADFEKAMSIDSVVRDAMHTQLKALAQSVVFDPVLQKIMTLELYAIDMKHYKKYKHDKKVLAGSVTGHLVPAVPGVTIRSAFDAIEKILNPIMIRTDLRVTILRFVYDTFADCVQGVILDGGETRWFHEVSAELLYQDMCLVTEFFENSAGVGIRLACPKSLARLQHAISGVMSVASEELVAQYEGLPFDDPVVVLTQTTVAKVLAHRKDQVAKKFILSLVKRKK